MEIFRENLQKLDGIHRELAEIQKSLQNCGRIGSQDPGKEVEMLKNSSSKLGYSLRGLKEFIDEFRRQSDKIDRSAQDLIQNLR